MKKWILTVVVGATITALALAINNEIKKHQGKK